MSGPRPQIASCKMHARCLLPCWKKPNRRWPNKSRLECGKCTLGRKMRLRRMRLRQEAHSCRVEEKTFGAGRPNTPPPHPEDSDPRYLGLACYLPGLSRPIPPGLVLDLNVLAHGAERRENARNGFWGRSGRQIHPQMDSQTRSKLGSRRLSNVPKPGTTASTMKKRKRSGKGLSAGVVEGRKERVGHLLRAFAARPKVASITHGSPNSRQ